MGLITLNCAWRSLLYITRALLSCDIRYHLDASRRYDYRPGMLTALCGGFNSPIFPSSIITTSNVTALSVEIYVKWYTIICANTKRRKVCSYILS